MNREIKFRAWMTSIKKMSHIFSIQDIPVFKIGIPDSAIICQFTGLNDKNGNPIFEGDIIKQFGNHKPFQVEFFNSAWRAYRIYILGTEIKADAMEIVGNIYEHPNLLNHE